MVLQQLLSVLKDHNIRIQIVDGRLELSGPTERLDSEFIEQIREQKKELMSYLVGLAKPNGDIIEQIPEAYFYNLSHAQERLWLEQQLDPKSIAYNMPVAYYLNGDLVVAYLQAAFSSLIQRHESLRTSFRIIEGEVRQVVGPYHEHKYPLNFDDLSGLEDAERSAKILVQNQIKTVFNLIEGPLLKANLWKIEEKKYVFALTIHHIISDGWSMQVMIDEILTYYEAHIRREADKLSPLRIHYKEFANWQHRHFMSEGLVYHRNYWMQEFEEPALPLILPTDYDRPGIKSFNGDVAVVTLGKEHTKRLKQISAVHKGTLFVTLLSFVEVLLYKYTGQKDITIGTPSHGRNHPELKDQIGVYLNMLPLRVNLVDDFSFKDLLEVVKRKVFSAYEHEIYPFDKLVEDLVLERDLSRSPLFDVVVQFEETYFTARKEIRFDAIKADSFRFDFPISKYDLLFYFKELEDDTLNIVINYNTDLFKKKTIDETFLRDLLGIIEIIGTDCERRLSSIDLLSGTHRKDADFMKPIGLLGDIHLYEEKLIHTLFEERAEATKDKIVIEHNHICLTYNELNGKCNRIAHFFRDRGAKPGYIVGVILPPGIDLVMSMLSVFKSGGIYLPIDLSFSRKRLESIFSQTCPEILITYKGWEHQVKNIIEELQIDSQVVTFIEDGELIDGDQFTISGRSRLPIDLSTYPDDNPPLVNKAEDGCYIFYTSGSTGEGKAILGWHAGLSHFLEWQRNEFSIDEHHRVSQLTQLTFDPSLRDILLPLSSGATLCIPPAKDNIPRLVRWLETSRVSLIHCVPTLFRLLTKELRSRKENVFLKNLRLLFLAGEVAYVKDVAQWREIVGDHVQLVNLYGPTETTLAKFFYRIGLVSGNPLQILPVGKPISNTVAAIINDKHICRPGEIGEIFLKTPFWSKGYYNNSPLTKTVFVQNPLMEEDMDTVYRTGDIGRYTEDNKIEVIGRIDDQVKVNGIRVELKEIELATWSIEGVEEVVVVIHRNNDLDNELICYYTGSIDDDSLKSLLRSKLNDNIIPSYFIRLNEFPTNLNGKVDKRALPKPEEILIGKSDYEATKGELETKLEEIWKEVLGFSRIGRGISFFRIGGTSLKAVKVISRIQREFNIELKISDLFTSQNIEELAKVVAKASAKVFAFIEPIEERPHYTLSHAQKRLWIQQELNPTFVGYNLSAAYRLDGSLNVEALRFAFKSLVQRHESLRTTFVSIGGEPRQIVNSFEICGFDLHYEDLCEYADPESEVKDRVRKLGQEVFNLIKGPLVRAALWRVGGKEFVFSLVMHHIISDGWSIQVLVKEALTLYESYDRSEQIVLYPLRIQYKDYTHWQLKQLQESQLISQQEYWVNQLSGELPILEMPTDFPRPSVKTFRGGTIAVLLEDSITKGLLELSHKNEVTLFMTLLAAVKAFFSKYTCQEDIVLGSPVAGRNHTDLENQIGFYVNILALRTRFSRNDSFNRLLELVKETVLDAFEHQTYPFDRLMEDLNYKRDMNRSPLFDVVVVLQNDMANRGGITELKGVSVSKYNIEEIPSVVDLRIEFIETGKGIYINFDYSLDLFTRASAESLLQHLINLFRSIIDVPSCSIAYLPFMSANEEWRLLTDFNNTRVQYQENDTIHSIFEERVKEEPDKPAVFYQGESITYGDLNCQANSLAQHLRENLKVRPNDIVGIVAERSIKLVISIMGILKAGGAYLFIDPSIPEGRKQYIVSNSDIRVLIVDSSYMFDLGFFEGSMFVLDIELPTLPAGIDNLRSVNAPEDLAYVIYTSGSTGEPKGVLVGHSGVLNLANWQKENFKIRAEGRILQYFSYSFDGAVGETFMALLNGACMFMLNKDDLTPDRMINFINENLISVGVFVPSFLKELDPNSIENGDFIVVSVGEVCPVNLAVEWSKRCRFMNAYGPTEYTVYSHLLEVDGKWHAETSRVPIGKPIHNTKSYILDEDLGLVPIGCTGELYLSGAGMAKGYLKNHISMERKFLPNPFFLKDKFIDHGKVIFKDTGDWISSFRKEMLSHSREIDLTEFPKLMTRKEISDIVGALDKDLVAFTDAYVERYAEDTASFECFCRYLMEGFNHTYDSCGISKVALGTILSYNDFKGLKGIDFGFGNASIMKSLRSMGADITGLDLSPFFVQRAREEKLNVYAAKVDVGQEEFQRLNNLKMDFYDFAISTLLLDRLENPINLIRNMMLVLKPEGRFALQTLLPIVPVDDGDIEEKITYTPPENRITLGENIEADKLKLIQLLYDSGLRDIEVCEIPYVIFSRDGLQEYNMWSFYGRKSAATDVLDSCYTVMYRTGDLAKYRTDGNIEFLGRIDQQVKIRGFRVELEEIENVLSLYQGIRNCAVLLHEDKQGEKFLAAYYVSDTRSDTSDMRRHLAERLPDFMIPAYFVKMNSLPLTSAGKINRKEIVFPEALTTGLQSVHTAPRNRTESELVEIWREVLRKDIVGIDDNFFSLGGDSIKSIRIIVAVEKRVGAQTTIGDVFTHQTIRQFGEFVDSKRAGSDLYEDQSKGLRIIEDLQRSILNDEADLNKLPIGYEDLYPIGPIEAGMIYSSLLRPEEPVYYEQVIYNYQISHIRRFLKTFELLIRKHDIYRTRFYINRFREPLKVVMKDIDAPIFIEDISMLTEAEQIKRINAYAHDDLDKRLTFDGDILWKIKLFKLDNGGSYTVVQSMHHAISDGWSNSIFMREFSDLLNDKNLLAIESLPSLKHSYKDYCAIVLGRQASESARNYWKRKLFNYTRNRLPFNFSGRRKQSLNQLGRVNRTLSRELLASLEQIEFNNQVSFQSICLSAYVYWMHLICAENDVVVGIVSHDRPAIEDGDKILGTFLNTIPFRIDLAEVTDGLSLIRTVNNSMIEIKRHEIHLSDIVNAIGENAFVGNPIFDCILNFTDFYELENLHNEVIHQLDKSSLFTNSITAGNDMTNTLLDLEITRTIGVFNVSLKFAKAYFEEQDIQYALTLYVRILELFAENAGASLNGAALLTEEERKRILYDFNDTVRPYPRNETLHGLFERRVETCGNNIALSCKDGCLSYEELNASANRLAHYLIQQGVNRGDQVGIHCERNTEMIIALLAVLKSGASYVPIESGYPRKRREFILSNSKVAFLLTDQISDNLPPDNYHSILISDGIAKGSSPLNLSVEMSAEDLAYTIYTSGSTGRPKGVMIEHHAAVNLVEWVSREFKVDSSDRLLFITSIGFDLSVYDIFGTLAAGGTIAIVNQGDVQDVRRLQRIIKEQSITFWNSVPTTMQYLINELDATGKNFIQDRLKTVFLSGDWIGTNLPERIIRYFPNAIVISLGGATEGTVWSNYYPIGKIDPSWSSIPYGKPITNNFFYILDAHGNPVPEGICGELYIGGVGVARGYANEVEKTAAAFVKDPFNSGFGERMYRTGDLGRLLPNGQMEFLGRLDHQVKIRGFRVELGEIENQLIKFNGIKEALVNIFKDGNGANYLCAYIVSEALVDETALLQYLAAYLPGYMIPSHYIQPEKMPLNSNGKLDRKLLPLPEMNGLDHRTYVAAQNELEKRLIDIWESILEINGLGITDDLLERGAHSLNLGAFINRAYRQLNVELNLREVFEHTTIRRLAGLVRSKSSKTFQEIEQVAPQDYYSASHAQKRIWIEHQVDPGSIVYNISSAYRLNGNLKIDALEKAFLVLIERHESLRTTFTSVDGQLQQFIHELQSIEFALHVEDLCDNPQKEEKVQALVLWQAQAPFDLMKGPLLRADLWRLSEESYVIAVTMHHIISDGWSMQILLDELMVLYDAFQHGSRNPLKPLRIQYKDYAAWHLKQLQGASLEDYQQYWRHLFAEEAPVLALATDYKRPAIKTYVGGRVSQEISISLVLALKELSQRHGTSLFMTLMAAVKALLYHYTGQEDIVIGTPVAGRDYDDLDDQIGFYVNMLALRTRFSGADTFEQLLARVKETMLGAYEHQIYPFDQLVEELPFKRDISRSPLFDMVVVMQNTMAPVSHINELKGIEVGNYNTGIISSIVDLRLECIEIESGLVLNLDFNKALFEAESALVLIGRLEKILGAIAKNATCLINDIDIKLPQEVEADRIDFNIEFDL